MRNIVAGLLLIAAGQGVIRSSGKWKVQLLTANSEHDAMDAYDELRAAGYDTHIRPLQGEQYQLCPAVPWCKRWRAN